MGCTTMPKGRWWNKTQDPHRLPLEGGGIDVLGGTPRCGSAMRTGKGRLMDGLEASVETIGDQSTKWVKYSDIQHITCRERKNIV